MSLGMVVLNYNDAETTIKFLNKISTYENISKVVIVDNNSKDDSVENIKNNFKIDNEKYIMIESDENKGYGSGNNLGIKELEKFKDIKYIAISNPDIIISEESINKQINVLEKHREISVVSGNIIEHGKRAIDNAWKTPSYLQCILQTIPLIDKIVDKSLGYDLSYYSESEISAVEAIKGCFFIAKSNIFKEIGYFDEDTFLYYEENIIAKKMKNKGYRAAIINSADIIHEHGVTINKSYKRIEKFKILNNSRKVYMKKCLKVNSVKMALYEFIQFIGINIRKIMYFVQSLV